MADRVDHRQRRVPFGDRLGRPASGDFGDLTRWLCHRGVRRAIQVAAGVSVMFACAAVPVAQEVTAPALKAAFIFNFVKFTTWPSEALPADAPLVMCVVDAPDVGAALSQSVGGRVVLGHEMRVLQTNDQDVLRTCHVLFVSGSRATARETAALVSAMPVLTVSDVYGFNAAGGVVQLHLQQGQLRFAVARDAARTSRLQISARLLALARQP